MPKTTLILGASANVERYAYLAAERLYQKGLPFELLGNKTGEIFGKKIETESNKITKEIDTVTMYLGEKNQETYQDFILKLKPKRVIFNPGAENEKFAKTLENAGIQTIEACTLVMLGTGQY
jgi:uncharacterized protein